MKQSFVTPIIEKVARELGVQITTASGRRIYFRGTNFDINSLGASEIARDKAYAAYFMKRLGYPTPAGEEFFTKRWCSIIGSRRNPEAAYRYAKHIGFPVIVKPNSKSQGSGVALVHTKREMAQAVNAFSQRENVFLVQELVIGNDYRIVVLDDEVISAYQRLPLSVVGDGRASVQELLRLKQKEFKRAGRDTVIPADDIRITNRLERLGLSRRSVLGERETVELLPNANLSTGGDAVDVTDTLHPHWRALSLRLCKDMNLRYCGVDVIVQGTLADPPSSYVVIEVNAAPGLDNYASVGKRQRQVVENLYKKVLKAMLK